MVLSAGTICHVRRDGSCARTVQLILAADVVIMSVIMKV
jgi:hypothetical protein